MKKQIIKLLNNNLSFSPGLGLLDLDEFNELMSILSNKLSELYCYNNKLINLDNITNNLKILNCSYPNNVFG